MVERSQNLQEKLQAPVKGALVKGVNSGNHLLLTKGGKDYNIFLSSVQPPNIGSSTRAEEPFGFEAREFLREKYIGKKCDFYPEYNLGGRDFGTLLINGENAALQLVQAGLAKVIEKKGAMQVSAHHDELTAAYNEAKTKKLAMHATGDTKFLEKHTRQVTYYSDSNYSPLKLFEEAKVIDKPLEAIVEYVFSASYLAVYIHKFQTQAKISMVHLFTPQQDKAFVAEGKAFVEKLLLHRTVGIKLDRYEPGQEGTQGNLYARIYHPAGDIAYEILKNGLTKLQAPKTTDFDADYYKTLKEAQLIAQSKQLKIWKDFKASGQEEKKQQKPSTTDFTGKVAEVHSGDSLTVERDSDRQFIKVYLATVKAPVLNKKAGEEPDAWAWDSKEALRQAAIGKKVKVIMEYSRTVKVAEQDRNMDFASVILDKNDKNLSVILLEKGLLKTNISRSGDNASRFIEDLLSAEKKAEQARVGVHSTVPAPIRVFNDVVSNTKRAKDFEAMVLKRPNRKINGVVEYCFSGMRFKVRLDSESTAIAVNLLGVRTMAQDKNQPKLEELAKDALQHAKDTLYQRDVIVDLEFADKRGTFFGTVQLKNTKEDFGLNLVENGLAEISVIGNKAPANIAELEAAEQRARDEQIGIWQKGLQLGASSGGAQVKENERLQVLMTDITDASRFYVRILQGSQYSTIEFEMGRFNPSAHEDLEKPIKKGTICAAKFKLDESWYRAKVLSAVGKGEYEVQFIDFGNTDTVNGSSGDLKKLPESLKQYPPQAQEASLAFIKVPRIGTDSGDEAAKIVQTQALDSITDAIVVGQSGSGHLSIVLFANKGEKDWNKSINCQLVEKGLASMNVGDSDDCPEEINDWFNYEEDAKEEQLGIWQYGGNLDDDAE